MRLAARRGVGIGDPNRDPRRRILGKEFHPRLVEFLPPLEIMKIERNLNDVSERGARSRQYRLEVTQRLSRLLQRVGNHTALPAGSRITASNRR